MRSLDELTRREFRRLQERARGDDAEFAEHLVATLVDGEVDRTDWYDVVTERGTKHEVKSVHTRIDGRDRHNRVEVDGRVRLWESQHRSLTAAMGAEDQTAWYVFVLLDQHDQPLDVVRKRPSTVTRIVRDLDGWDDSGHEEMGRQQKIPLDEVF